MNRAAIIRAYRAATKAWKASVKLKRPQAEQDRLEARHARALTQLVKAWVKS